MGRGDGQLSVKKAGTDGTSGSCVVAGNLYIIPESGPTSAYPNGGDASAEAGSTVFSVSTTVNGNVYLAGTGDLSSSGNVTVGNILTNGSVTLTSGTVKVNGSIYSVGNVNVTLNGGSYITGNVYSEAGTVTITMSGGGRLRDRSTQVLCGPPLRHPAPAVGYVRPLLRQGPRDAIPEQSLPIPHGVELLRL